jgi:hypothetical protein
MGREDSLELTADPTGSWRPKLASGRAKMIARFRTVADFGALITWECPQL